MFFPVEDPDKSAEDDHGRSEEDTGGALDHDNLHADTSAYGGQENVSWDEVVKRFKTA